MNVDAAESYGLDRVGLVSRSALCVGGIHRCLNGRVDVGEHAVVHDVQDVADLADFAGDHELSTPIV